MSPIFIKPSLLAATVAILMVGCTDQTRDQYSQAGQTAGDALKTDLKKGEKAAVAATDAAKKSLKEDQVKAAKEEKQLSDATITPKIKSALGSAAKLDSSKVDVTTVGHTTTLSGAVPSVDEKKRAGQIAKGVAGSQYKVVDKLAVSHG